MIRKYRLPLQTKGYVETIRVPQYDQSYMLVFEIHGLPEGTTDLEDYTAKMEGTRSDGLKYEYTGTISGASVSFEIDTRMTAAAGNGEARIVFSYASTGEIYASANFQTYIDASPVPDDAAEADTEEARSIAEQIQEIVSTAASQTTAEAERIVADLEADVASVKEDLSGLDNAFKELVVLTPYWSEGYLSATGTVAKDGSYTAMTTEGIPIVGGMTFDWSLAYSASHTQWIAYCLYDNDGVFISPRVIVNSSSFKTASGTITIPSGAKYIRFSFRIYEDLYPTLIASFNGAIYDSCQSVSDYSNNIVNNLYRRWNDPVYISNNGLPYTSDSRIEYTTEYIPAENGDVYFHYALTNDTPWMAVSFYDANYAYISNSRITTIDGTRIEGNLQYAYQKVTVPSGAVYLRACTRTDGLGQYCLLKQGDNWITDNFISQKIAEFSDSSKQDFLIAQTSDIDGINHQGYNTVAPANTLPAFKLSREKGFAWVETDVRFTSDDVPVLLHDPTINSRARNSDGSTISETIYISNITYEQALTYDFGIWKSSAYAGTKIPTLEQFVKLCKAIGLKAMIEIKYDEKATEANLKNVVDIVNACGMLKNVEFISFYASLLNVIVNYEPSASVMLIMNTVTDELIEDALSLKTSSNRVCIDAEYSALTSAIINKCITADLPLYVYTPNTVGAITSLDSYVSGVASDSINAPVVIYNANMT